MDFKKMVESMTPEIYENMKQSVETGKWPDGRKVEQEQLEIAIQAIMLYDAQHNSDIDEPFRVQADGRVSLGKSSATEKLINADRIILQQPLNKSDDVH